MPRSLIIFVGVDPTSANPSSEGKLALEQEFVDIEGEVLRAPHRDFEAMFVPAATDDRLMRLFIERSPRVVHYAGHGVDSRRVAGGSCAESRDIGLASDAIGIYLQDDQGGPQLVTARALTAMLKAAVPSVRLLVINACHSEALAEPLCGVVDCVITMAGAIGDHAARSFAAALYRAIANRRSIGDAFSHAVDTLIVKQFSGEQLPKCHTRSGLNAHEIFFTPEQDARPFEQQSHEFNAGRPRRLAQRQALLGCAVGVVMALALVAGAAGLLSLIEANGHAHDAREKSIPASTEADAHRGRAEIADQAMREMKSEDEHRPAEQEEENQAPGHALNEKGAQKHAQPQKLERPVRDAQRYATRPNANVSSQPSSLGVLNTGTIRRYIHDNYYGIKYCYEKQRLAKPSLTGTVTAQFLITPDGTVASSTASGLDDEVSRCVAGVIQNIEFPRSGDSVQVTYPFHFVLKE